MKRTVVIVGVSLLASNANAELTKLGDYSLGQPMKKTVFVKSATALGCSGSLKQSLDDSGKIQRIEITADSKCKPAAVEAQLEKEYGAKPVISTDKTAKLWEGKTGSAMVVTSPTGSVEIQILKPGAGAKRPCFADDGFAAFWKSFVATVEQPDKVTASFKFPLKNYDDKVKFKDAKSLAKKWATVLDDDDKKEIASGKLTPTCSINTGTYDLSLSSSNLSLEGKLVGGKWMWVEINDQASG